MRRIFSQSFFLIFLVSSLHFAIAQPPAPGQGRPPMAGMAAGHIFGKVVDASGKPVADASVMLLRSRMDSASGKLKSSLVKGIASSGNGEFSFEDVAMAGSLKVSISATGFANLEQPVTVGRGSSEKDLGKITLTAKAGELQEVTVVASKPLMKLDIDKKVFNVEKNIVSDGGTAVDVMKNVPGLNVDIDGNVSLRNSSPQILVDGRPTTLTLEQIPANAIESVEIMTNPSAKYDASGGGAGILNVVLKKNKKTGYNGSVRAGLNKYGAGDLGADFNLRQDKINFTGGINVRSSNGRSASLTERTNISDLPITSILQSGTEKNGGQMLFARAGLDYFITNKTTLSASVVRMHGNMQNSSRLDIDTDSLYTSGILSSFSQRRTTSERTIDGQGLVLGMKHLFEKPGEEWTADLNFFSGRNNSTATYATDYLSNGKNSIISDSRLQQILNGGNDKNFTFQTDYVKPLSATLKLETGVRVALRSRENFNDNYIYKAALAAYALVPSSASNYASSDNVIAAYGSVAGSKKSFSYKLGLRAESSSYTGSLTNTKESFSNRYPISLFPSIFLSQKLSDTEDLQFSVTRRINRPNFFQLIPFVDSTDNLNISKGNANLLPEFTYAYELNYMKQFPGNNTVLASVYYKQTENLITRYIYQETNPVTGSTALVNTYINANSSRSAGAELTAQNTITKWWNTSANINLYNSKINTGLSGTADVALWSWFTKLNSNFRLPSNFSIQVSGMYQSKTNLPVNSNQGGPGGGGAPGMTAQSASQGYINPFYSVDLAVKKAFLNNKFSFSLSVNDIFKSRKQDQYSSGDYFVQEYNRVRDQQMVRLNLAYNFGKIDALLFKRKSQGTGQTGSESVQ